MSAVAAVAVALLLATAPLGEGGRAPDALLVHHTLLAASLAVAIVAARGPLSARGRTVLAAVVPFALWAWWLASYRYAALLVLADVAAAAAIVYLAAVATAGGRVRLVFAGLAAGAFASVARGYSEWLGGAPVHGFFANPNHAACLVAAASPLGLDLVVDRRRPGATRLAAALLLALGYGFIALSGSKGGSLAAAVAAVVLLLGRGRRLVLAAAPALLALLVLLPTPLGRRVRVELWQDPLALERGRIWAASARMAADHLLGGGVGLGSFGEAVRRYNFPVEGTVARYGKLVNVAHNEYLELLAEASVPGLLLLVVPALLALGRGWARRREDGPGLVAAAGLAALLFQAAVDAVLHTPANLYALAAWLGVALAAPPGPASPPRPLPSAARPVALVLLAGLWAGGVLLPWLGDHSFARYRQHGAGVDLERAIRLEPGHAGYRAAFGRQAAADFRRHGRLEDLDEARWAFECAMALDPLSFRYRADLAGLEQEGVRGPLPAREMAERSLRHYREALAREPFDPRLHVNLAQLQAALGLSGEAAATVERAVTLEPSCRPCAELLGRLAAERGDAAGARRWRLEVARIDGLARGWSAGSGYERFLLGLDAQGSAPDRREAPDREAEAPAAAGSGP